MSELENGAMQRELAQTELMLPAWAVGELQRPVRGTREQRQRIMDQVRAAERPRRRASAAFHPRWFRRGVLSPTGAAIAAVFTAMLTLVGLPQGSGAPTAFWSEATIIRDTVVSAPISSRLANAIADTLRIVRFAIRAPGATRVALSGEFNAWSRTSTWMTRDEKTGLWVARVAVPRNAERYAFVVDGDEMVGAPAPQRLNVDSLSWAAGRFDSI